jgi:pilus assembly protein Flp/PilA
MTHLIERFVREDHGQDLIEYAMVGGLVALAVVTAVTAFRDELILLYDRLTSEVSKIGTPS